MVSSPYVCSPDYDLKFMAKFMTGHKVYGRVYGRSKVYGRVYGKVYGRLMTLRLGYLLVLNSQALSA